jgi:hypothetical protein
LAETVRHLDPAARQDDRRWVPLTLALPAVEESCELTVTTELPVGAAADFSWAVLGDPVLLVAPAAADVVALPGARAAGKAIATRARLPRARPASDRVEEAPLISLLLPVHDPEPGLLQQAIGSVLAQTSARWELCIVDDGSSRAGVSAIIDGAAWHHHVSVQRHESAQGISAATNAALRAASGAFVATLDHDDLLAPEAIATVGARLAADPAVDVLYTDNDKVAAGVRFSPSLKPGWSPELLRACMYTLHLSVYRRTLVEEIGGWRSEFDGAQDHDLMLRLSERTDRIVHLPQTLYSWRAHAGSVALGQLAKPHAYDRGLQAVSEHLGRSGVDAAAEALPIAGRYRVVYAPRLSERVAVVLPLPPRVADDPCLAEHLAAIAAALGADRGERPQFVVVAMTRVVAPGATLVTAGDPRWGPMARIGAEAAEADVLVLLDDLCAPLTADWLEELVGPVRIPGVSASSPLVIDGHDRVVHAGVAIVRGLPLPVHPGVDLNSPIEDLPPELTMVTDRSAAAGVVAIPRSALARASGPEARLDRLALTSLTAHLTTADGRVVCSPHAPWRLLGRPLGTDLDELRAFALAHADREDRYYNPRLWPDRAAHVIPRALQQTGRLSDIEAL